MGAFALGTTARAQTIINVGNSTDFYNAINTIDNNPTGNYTLNLTANVTMSQQALAIVSTGNITVAGNGYTINGAGAYRPFFIESGNVSLENLTISNA